MSLFRAENRRSLSNQKKSRTKRNTFSSSILNFQAGNFRITTKPVTEIAKPSPKSNLEAFMLQEYMSDPGYHSLNSRGMINELPHTTSQTAKLDVLVHQIGAVNQVPFKLDPSLLKRLNSYGADSNKGGAPGEFE